MKNKLFVFKGLLLILCVFLATNVVSVAASELPQAELGSSQNSVIKTVDVNKFLGYSEFRLSHPEVVAFNAFESEYFYLDIQSESFWIAPNSHLTVTHPQIDNDDATNYFRSRLQFTRNVEGGSDDGTLEVAHYPLSSGYISEKPYTLTIEFQVCNKNSCDEAYNESDYKTVTTKLDVYVLSKNDADIFKSKTLEFNTMFYIDPDGNPKISGLEVLNDVAAFANKLANFDLDTFKDKVNESALTLEDAIQGISTIITNDLEAVVDTQKQADLKQNQNILAFLASKELDSVTEEDIQQVSNLIDKYSEELAQLEDFPYFAFSEKNTDCTGNPNCVLYAQLKGELDFRPEIEAEINLEEKTGHLYLVTPEDKPFSLSLTATISANSNYNNSFTTPRHRLLNKKFFQVYPTPAGVPVVLSGRVSLFIQGEFDVDIAANAEIEFNFHQKDLFAIGAALNSDDLILDGTNCTDGTFKQVKLYKCRIRKKKGIRVNATVQGELASEATIWAYPEFEIMLYRNAAVVASIEPGIYGKAGLKSNLDGEVDLLELSQNNYFDADYGFTELEAGIKLRAGIRADFGVIYEKNGEEKTLGVCFPLKLGICSRDERYYTPELKVPLYSLPNLNLDQTGVIGDEQLLTITSNSGREGLNNTNHIKNIDWQLIGIAKDIFEFEDINSIPFPILDKSNITKKINVIDSSKLEFGREYTARVVYWSNLGYIFRQYQDVTFTYNPPQGELVIEFEKLTNSSLKLQWQGLSSATKYLVYRDGELIGTVLADGSNTLNYTDEAPGSLNAVYQVLPVSNGGVNYEQASFSFSETVVEKTDGFDYPIGNRGVDADGKPISFNEQLAEELNHSYSQGWVSDNHGRYAAGGSGWRNVQDVGSFYSQFGGVHPGEDWNLGSGSDDAGEQVFAVANGTVTHLQSTYRSGYQTGGYTLVIEHTLADETKVYSVYTHITAHSQEDGTLSENTAEFAIQVGDIVTRGQAIARLAKGMTALSPHLHFELRNKAPGDDLYPHDNGKGYYSHDKGEHSSLTAEQINSAFKVMQEDEGLLDPSDFIDFHRSGVTGVVTSIETSQAPKLGEEFTLTIYGENLPLTIAAAVHDANCGTLYDVTTQSAKLDCTPNNSGKLFVYVKKQSGGVYLNGAQDLWLSVAVSSNNVLGVEFTDTNFAQCVREHVDTQQVTRLADLTTLNCSNRNITDVSELSHMTGLTSLNLANNNLTTINLDDNLALNSADLRGNQFNQTTRDYLAAITRIADLKYVNTTPPTTATGKLNDTGITWCADGSNNNLDCPVSGYEGQDADHGRDALAKAGTLEKVGAGRGGFDFTKLDANGNDLPASASAWSCIRDNHTGLIWEVKTDDGGLHDKGDRYSWYNPNSNSNGGHPGYQYDAGNICYGYDSSNSATLCNTYAYVERVNTQSLCGASDWRMPNKEELRSIVDYGTTSPTIDIAYFPQARTGNYWTSSPYANDVFSAWTVHFSLGYGNTYSKYGYIRVRLVRGGQ